MRFKNFIIPSIVFCSFNILSNSIFAQSKNDSTVREQKDIMDIEKNVFKKKIPLQPDSIKIPPGKLQPDSIKIKPGKLLSAVLPGIGYTLVTGLTVVTSINVSFYTGNSANTHLSSINTVTEFSIFNHQITIPIESNIWSKGNKLNWLGDWRYYKYPTYTFGLGGHSVLSDADLIDYSYIRIYQEVLKNLYSNFFAGIGYNLDYHLNIKERGVGEFQKYNNNSIQTTSSGSLVHFLYDSRTNVNNPLKGFYGSVAYRSNFTFMGSDRNWQSLQLDFRKYIKLSSNSHNVLAFWSYNWFTFGGKPPYFDLPSTGWDTYSSTGRGYIQGRLRGTGLIYLESEYRFGITRNGLFGGVVFANAQSISEIQSNKFETILPGGGIGLRIKVNKFSGANFCIDYGFGIQGSRGLNLNLCEVF